MLSSALKHSNHDELEELSAVNKKAARIFHLKLKLEVYSDLFSPVETLLYITISVFSGVFMVFRFSSWYPFLYLISFIFLFALVLRSIFFAIGRKYNLRILIPLSPLVRFIYYLNKPFVLLIAFSKNLIIQQTHEEASREELTALVESAHEEGSIDPEEYRILKNIMNFSDVLVSDVMTPRTVVFSLPADEKVENIINHPEIQMYSRIPVWQGESIDDSVIGYVMTKDILQAALKGNESVKLRDLAREIYFIPENAELDIALDKFLKRRQHVFLVVDEYGGVEGLLSMEDVMETILGSEIVDEADRVVDLREFAKQKRDKRIASVSVQG